MLTRGTFGNIRLKNLLVPGVEGGVTVHFPDGARLPIYEAALRYQDEGVPTIVLAGREYGSGSSRDWAAKGPRLLGVRAVLAESLERIHRSNLIGMGLLPLEFLPGQSAASLGLTGSERFSLHGLGDLEPRSTRIVEVEADDGRTFSFEARVRIDTPVELDYFRSGGILQMVLRQMMRTD